MEVWKIIFLSKWVICRFHVNLPGCIWEIPKTLRRKWCKRMVCPRTCPVLGTPTSWIRHVKVGGPGIVARGLSDKLIDEFRNQPKPGTVCLLYNRNQWCFGRALVFYWGAQMFSRCPPKKLKTSEYMLGVNLGYWVWICSVPIQWKVIFFDFWFQIILHHFTSG